LIRDDADHLSPETSPSRVSGKAGVRRVNNLPLYLVLIGVVIFLVIMVMVAIDRAGRQRPAVGPKDKGGNTNGLAEQIAGEKKTGFIPPAKPRPSEAAPLSIPIARPDNPDTPPAPPSAKPRNDDADRIRKAKMQQLEDAIRAKTNVQVVQLGGRASVADSVPNGARSNQGVIPATPSSAPAGREETLARLTAMRRQTESAQPRDDPTAAYKTRSQQIQASGLAGGSDSAPSASNLLPPQQPMPPGPSENRNEIDKFAGQGRGDRWKLDSKPEPPRTPFELRAGFVIPAILISGINSELPGQIMAQVSEDVYDTPSSRHKLVPQGSRLVGTYSSELVYGQSRVLIAWQRIVFPDGKAMDIGAMPGADGAGYAGFKDQVNNHYLRIFGSALLMSAVTAGVAYSQDRNNHDRGQYSAPTASSELSAAVGQQLGQVAAQMIAKNLNIAPTLEIRPGFRFNVTVVKDLTFPKPYEAFDY
jgi:type IV secretory pathway VirB10-like protein